MSDEKPTDATGGVPFYDDERGEGRTGVIDRYRLLQQLGQGGFGVVWLAEQTEPVKRRVALKIIKLGMDTKQVIARFDVERQALAMMDHPSIAKVFDAGTTASGRPYFVMELVQGVGLLEYCDSARLATEERLRLFAQVCHAIQHAHQKGIIHRDLKPSNILVTILDGKPVPKVIDFGIAKATAAELTSRTIFTEQGQMIGTPAYMSPEQADLTALDIDTRSDVYSLGVVLYELLTGTTPFDTRDLFNRGFAEMVRVIKEVEPERPSTRISTQGAAASTTAQRRDVDVARLRSLLRGDLDWITMRCLEKDRTRRYDSAGNLAQDVERYLEGEAVTAAPPSAAYRLRKLVRRNRGLVLAAGIVAGSLVAGMAGTLWQAKVASEQRDVAKEAAWRANEAADAERARADELRDVSSFQSRMLSQVDVTAAGVRLVGDIRARHRAAIDKEGLAAEARDEAIRELDAQLVRINATDVAAAVIDDTLLKPAVQTVREFEKQPLVEAALCQTLADVYLALGRFDAARPLQDRALDTRRRRLGNEHRDTIVSILGAGHVARRRGRADDATPLYDEALELSRKVHGNDALPTLFCMSNVAGLLRVRFKRAEAEPILRAVMEARRRVQGPDHPMTLEAVSSYGGVIASLGRRAEAEPYYREALEGRRRVLGDDAPATMESIGDMASFLLGARRVSEAEPYLREALERTRRVLGEDHPVTVNAIRMMAAFENLQGRFAEAEALQRDVLERSRRTIGADHPSSIGMLTAVAIAVQNQGRRTEALPLHEEALTRSRRTFGDDHVETITAISNLGVLRWQLGQLEDAAKLIREAADRARRVCGADDQVTLNSLNNLGAVLVLRGEFDEAERYCREAVEGRERLFGPSDDRTAHYRVGLGAALTGQKKFEEAEGQLLRAESALSTAPPLAEPSRKKCRDALIALYEAWHAAAPGAGHDDRAASRRGAVTTRPR